jgi:hypothetical protein
MWPMLFLLEVLLLPVLREACVPEALELMLLREGALVLWGHTAGVRVLPTDPLSEAENCC